MKMLTGELINKIIERGLGWVLAHSKHFQEYVNWHNNSPEFIRVSGLSDGYFVYNGVKFCISRELWFVRDILDDYHFDDIAAGDTVLDIGAHIGGFSLLAAKKAKHVFAVEPLYTDELRANIALNEIKNTTVLEWGIGVDNDKYIKFGGKSGNIKLMKLSEILNDVGRCDFLKIDCEGCEWDIDVSDLKKFRRIEGEIHNFDGKHDFKLFEKKLIEAGFSYTLEPRGEQTCLFHARANENKMLQREERNC